MEDENLNLNIPQALHVPLGKSFNIYESGYF